MLLDALSISRLLLRASPDTLDVLARITTQIEQGKCKLLIRQSLDDTGVNAALIYDDDTGIHSHGKGDTVADALLALISDYRE